MRNLDITALRSFLAVAQSGGVTRAAGFLNLTQSAVSMQLKRLEEVLEQRLFERSGRGVTLTPAGAQLLTYAQRIIALNDEAYSRLTDQEWEGDIVLGVPDDILHPVVPEVLRRMGAEFPRVRIDLISASSYRLKQRFARGTMDVILTTEAERDAGGETLARAPLQWIGAPGGMAWQGRPLRLAFCSYCAFRDVTTSSLDAAGIPWDLSMSTEQDRAVEAMVRADLAVTISLQGHAPPMLEPVPAKAGLPELGVHRINLYATATRTLPIEALVGFLRSGFAAHESVAA